MKLHATVVGLMLFAAVTATAQEPNKPTQQQSRSMVLDVDIVDVSLGQLPEIEKVIKDKRQFDRLVAEGKLHPIASIQARARAGESASAHIGQRLPIQTSTTPQIQYENTGLSLDFMPLFFDAERILVKLKIELSAVLRNDNIPAPTFIQRTVSNVVNLKSGEPTLLLSVAQREGLTPPVSQGGGRAGESTGANFVIVLNARLVD
jgi:Bacterial type II and III secretion system protein